MLLSNFVILSEAKDLRTSRSLGVAFALLHDNLLQILRDLNIPSQLLLHQIAQRARSVRLTVNQIGRLWPVAECAQPLQQLGWIGMIAELLERGNLGANGNHITEDLHFVGLIFNCETPRPRRLEADRSEERRVGKECRS